MAWVSTLLQRLQVRVLLPFVVQAAFFVTVHELQRWPRAGELSSKTCLWQYEQVYLMPPGRSHQGLWGRGFQLCIPLGDSGHPAVDGVACAAGSAPRIRIKASARAAIRFIAIISGLLGVVSRFRGSIGHLLRCPPIDYFG